MAKNRKNFAGNKIIVDETKEIFGDVVILTRTISQLGYPTHQALRNWYQEYKKNGGLHQKFKRAPIHTEQQKTAQPKCLSLKYGPCKIKDFVGRVGTV